MMGLKFGQTEKFKSIFRFVAVRYYYKKLIGQFESFSCNSLFVFEFDTFRHRNTSIKVTSNNYEVDYSYFFVIKKKKNGGLYFVG